jgi:hypothetical protein
MNQPIVIFSAKNNGCVYMLPHCLFLHNDEIPSFSANITGRYKNGGVLEVLLSFCITLLRASSM